MLDHVGADYHVLCGQVRDRCAECCGNGTRAWQAFGRSSQHRGRDVCERERRWRAVRVDPRLCKRTCPGSDIHHPRLWSRWRCGVHQARICLDKSKPGDAVLPSCRRRIVDRPECRSLGLWTGSGKVWCEAQHGVSGPCILPVFKRRVAQAGVWPRHLDQRAGRGLRRERTVRASLWAWVQA